MSIKLSCVHYFLISLSRLEAATKLQQKLKNEKVKELSCLFNNMSFITEMGEMGDMKMDNEKNNLK